MARPTIEDVGIQVPGVGEVFYIANPGYGIAEYMLRRDCPACPAQPPAERDLRRARVPPHKRLSNRWSLNTSYLLSRLYGNYSGLASSDENGRNSPSVNRFFDGLYMSFDQTGQPVYGAPQHRPSAPVQAAGRPTTAVGHDVGADMIFVASGTPQQSQITVKSVPVFYQGRGDLGRSPVFSSPT